MRDPHPDTHATLETHDDHDPVPRRPGDSYQAGACNIGPAEIARRRRSGIVGLAVTAALAVALVVADATPIVRLAVAVPLFVGILGLVQARMRFCVGFAMGGLTNFGDLGGQTKVADSAAVRADRRRAMGVTLAVAAVAGVLAVGFALLPL